MGAAYLIPIFNIMYLKQGCFFLKVKPSDLHLFVIRCSNKNNISHCTGMFFLTLSYNLKKLNRHRDWYLNSIVT